jgi:glycosyl transferase family 2
MDIILERSPIASSALSVILVAESDGWEEALAAWATYLNGLDREYELLLVSERSSLRVEEAASRYARGRAFPPPETGGLGGALKPALEAARHPLVFYARCNSHYKPSDLQQLLKCIDKVDIVTGVRTYPPGAPRRRWRSLAYWFLLRSLFAVRLRDPGCVFALARRSIFQRIPLQSRGAFAHGEILAKANFLGCMMLDTPVSYQPGAGDDADPKLRDVWSDVRRVFFHPDFGPPEVRLELGPEKKPTPEPTATAAGETASGGP